MNKLNLYPFQFFPKHVYRLWGGKRFNDSFKREVSENQLGESWEISALKETSSIVRNGPLKEFSLRDLIDRFPEAVLGKSVVDRFGKEFPLLIKFIDAKMPLSVQVHPNDKLAKERHNCSGKNEMWYVIEAEENAEITLGFQHKLDKASYQTLIEEGRLKEVLRRVKVQEGDVISVPAGLLHAIGGGVLLAEIQQASDITYRVYDYDRVDVKTSTKRELHQAMAIDAIDFSLDNQSIVSYEKHLNQPNLLLNTPYFKTTFLPIKEEYHLNYSDRQAFSVLICVKGEATLSSQGYKVTLTKGGCVLIPAVLDEVVLSGTAQLLEVTI